MITPIRGRKLHKQVFYIATVFIIRNDNPDKGTETFKTVVIYSCSELKIRNDNPDKGTETPIEVKN